MQKVEGMEAELELVINDFTRKKKRGKSSKDFNWGAN